MEVNKIHNINFLDNTLPDKCANLIIADPPYFEVKGAFDFVWSDMKAYLQDVEKWCLECKRLLADNGTLFWYGHAKNIAYTQVIFDMHFNLINNLVWDKGSFMGLEESEGLRSFAPCTERILMYGSKAQDTTGLEVIKLDVNNFQTLRQYFKELQEFIGTPKSKIVQQVGQTADHCFRWGSTQFDLPTIETYNKLIEQFGINKYKGFKEYETLRQEYETLRRPFANYFKLQEIFRFSNEAVKTGAKYDHDTVKPETLTRALIMTCSRVNDLVVVPFAGSGTECAMSVKEGRKTIGFEITEKHAKMSNDRVQNILRQPSLFVGS